jgi:uncharacterized protein YndB with AHSA1/START domain
MKRLALLCLITIISPMAIAQERALNLETTVKATPAQAFNAWTTTEGIKTFFAPDGKVEARSNGLYEIHMNPLAPPGEKGADDMRVLAIQENKMISFTWSAPPSFPEARKQRTVVILRFSPVSDNETKVTLHQTGWGDGGEWDKTFEYFGKAWAYVLGNFKKRFEQGPMDWAPYLERMKAAMAAQKK